MVCSLRTDITAASKIALNCNVNWLLWPTGQKSIKKIEIVCFHRHFSE